MLELLGWAAEPIALERLLEVFWVDWTWPNYKFTQR